MPDRPRLTDEWRASPWTLKAFAVLQVASVAFSLAIKVVADEGRAIRPGGLIFSAAITTLTLYWLLRRSRATRIFMVVWSTLGLLVVSLGLFFREPPYGYAVAVAWMFFSATSLGLMLHPATRAWCDRRLRLTDPERLSRSRTPEV